MKIVIQDTLCGNFLYPDGSWGREIAGAVDFASSTQAEKHCREQQLRDVEVVITFDRGERTVRFKP